jgi:hypothetical protein
MAKKKLNDYEKKREKQFAAQQRARDKQMAKLNDPVYQAEQLEKKIAQSNKQREKLATPEHQAKVRAQQEASIQRQMEKKKTADPAKKRKSSTKVATKSITAGAGLKRTSLPKTTKSIIRKTAIKKTSMAGKTPTRSEKEMHDKIAQIGCICCVNLGFIEAFESGQPVSVHHTDGRTKPHAHEVCLPLCAGHHDTPLPTKAERERHPLVFPIHAKGKEGGKKLWEAQNGTQEQLVLQCWAMINYTPIFSTLLESVTNE